MRSPQEGTRGFEPRDPSSLTVFHTMLKSRAIGRLNRNDNLANSKALMAEEEGFKPPRPFRV